MNLPIRSLFLAGATVLLACGCETHQRAIYSTHPPKNLRVIRPGEASPAEAAAADVTAPPSETSTRVPATGGPSLPPAAQ